MPSLTERIQSAFSKSGLILAKFDGSISWNIEQSKNGYNRFTLARPHDQLHGVKIPAICLAEFNSDVDKSCYLGVIDNKSTITTLETRATFKYFKLVSNRSLEELAESIDDNRFRRDFKVRLRQLHSIGHLGPKLSIEILKKLAHDNENLITELLEIIQPDTKKSDLLWAQGDALNFAIKAFGLSPNEATEEAQAPFHLLEDSVVWQDATVLPGFDLIQSHVEGHREFRRGQERMDVFMANRGPLEKMLGVDLIYINQTQGNMVMLQYKMLEHNKSEKQWYYRPDEQFEIERSRMIVPQIDQPIDDYRLNNSPFYFKFAKRKPDSNQAASIIVSNEHIDTILESPKALGPKGGKRIGYESLEGNYLRETNIVSLIQSGYIGTHRAHTEALRPIIKQAIKGDKAIVLAWQQKAHKKAEAQNSTAT